MSNYILTAVKDKLGNFFGVTVHQNKDIAIRDFLIALKSEGSLMYASSVDFDLYMLGLIDVSTGVIESSVELLQKGDSVVK